MIYGGGANVAHQLGILSNADNGEYVSKLTAITGINAQKIRCIALGWQQTVIVMNNGDLYATGREDVITGSDSSRVFESFTKISISKEDITWAAAGEEYTLYLTRSGKVILCDKRTDGGKNEVQLKKNAISVFGGAFYGGVIDEEGHAYFLDSNDPYKSPTRYESPSPAVELACCRSFKAVLLTNFQVYGNGELNNNQNYFAPVASLAGQKIIKISGYLNSCFALRNDGLVFSYGENNQGQLGNNSTTRNFSHFQVVRIPNDEKIIDIACGSHSLLLSESGKLFGCGWNGWNQLFHKSSIGKVLEVVPIEIEPIVNNIFVGNAHSVVISEVNLPENPAKQKMLISDNKSLLAQIVQQKQRISQLEAQVAQLKGQLEDKIEEARQQSHNENKELATRIDDYQQNMYSLINSLAETGLNIINQ